MVLQDLGLPPDPEGVLEGFTTLEQILGLAPATKVIVVTGHGDQQNAVKAVGLGAYDFYQKPVDTNVLQLIVNRAYQIYELEQENQRLLRERGVSPLDGIVAASEKMLPMTSGASGPARGSSASSAGSKIVLHCGCFGNVETQTPSTQAPPPPTAHRSRPLADPPRCRPYPDEHEPIQAHP